MSNCFSGCKTTITSFAKQAVGWGKDFASGLAGGIRSAAGKVIDAAKGLASKIKSFLHFSRPDEGPLREYESWMPDFVQGLANGINSNKYKVIDAVKSMSAGMTLSPMSAPTLKNVGNTAGSVNTQDTGSARGTDEKLYTLLNRLLVAIQDTGGDITVPVYLGNDLIDEQIIRATDRRTLRSGGRA